MFTATIVLPVIFVVFAWWISTGAILYLDQKPPATYRASFTGGTIAGAIGLLVIVFASHTTDVASAYLAFTGALLIWGWQEMAFLMGFITGPRRTACPPFAREWQRFILATEAILYHELALAASVGLVAAVTWNHPNQVGAQSLFILWVMRLSSKLNLFLGVRNRYESMLPPHLSHLTSYFGRPALNLLFPVVVTAASVACYLMWQSALAPQVSPFGATALCLLATLLTLAVLEHWFLVIPLSVESMWNWAMGGRNISDAPRGDVSR